MLIVFLESSVDPDDVERKWEEADLERYLATLRRGNPLATLRERISTGRRLVVFTEGDGGDAPWHQPAFVFVEDTRIVSPMDSAAACDPNRGTRKSHLPDEPLDRPLPAAR